MEGTATDQAGAAAGNRTDGTASVMRGASGQDVELVAFETELSARIRASADDAIDWIVESPYTLRILRTTAAAYLGRSHLKLADVEDAVADAQVTLLRGMRGHNSPLCQWDSTRKAGFWPNLFRWRIKTHIERRIEESDRARQLESRKGPTRREECDQFNPAREDDSTDLRIDLEEVMKLLSVEQQQLFRLVHDRGLSLRCVEKITGVNRHKLAVMWEEVFLLLRNYLNSYS